jgi:hypothetical protein
MHGGKIAAWRKEYNEESPHNSLGYRTPKDVAEDFYPYKGQLSKAWLPDEVFNVDDLPQTVRFPRRHAFRYLKIQVIDTSPKDAARFENIQLHAVTSAQRDAPSAKSTP